MPSPLSHMQMKEHREPHSRDPPWPEAERQQSSQSSSPPDRQMVASAPLTAVVPLSEVGPLKFQSLPFSRAAASGPRAQLQLLLPANLVRGTLIPQAHLAEIANGCNVHIDLFEEYPMGQLRTVISGTCAANSLALLMIQWRLWFAMSA